MLVGAGGSAHAPGAYSMLADYFPPPKLPRAIGFLQLGFIGGTALGIFFGGQLIGLAAELAGEPLDGLTIRGWQWVLMMVGRPGLVIALLLLLAREPPRRGRTAQGKSLPVKAVLREIWARRVHVPAAVHRAGLQRHAIPGPAGLACAVPDPDLRLERGPDRQMAGSHVPGVFAAGRRARHGVRRVAGEALQGCPRARRDDTVHARGAV